MNAIRYAPVNSKRLPKSIQAQLGAILYPEQQPGQQIAIDAVHHGDARAILPQIAPNSVALSVWSPPYFVGKSYEADWEFEDWQSLLSEVIKLHFAVIKPGGFLVINIADIL